MRLKLKKNIQEIHFFYTTWHGMVRSAGPLNFFTFLLHSIHGEKIFFPRILQRIASCRKKLLLFCSLLFGVFWPLIQAHQHLQQHTVTPNIWTWLHHHHRPPDLYHQKTHHITQYTSIYIGLKKTTDFFSCNFFHHYVPWQKTHLSIFSLLADDAHKYENNLRLFSFLFIFYFFRLFFRLTVFI